MIAHVYFQLRLLIATLRFRYWCRVCAGQRRVWHRAIDDDRLRKAMLDRAHYRAKAARVWQ